MSKNLRQLYRLGKVRFFPSAFESQGGLKEEERVRMRVKREIDVETMMATKGIECHPPERKKISSVLTRLLLVPVAATFFTLSCLLVTLSPLPSFPALILQYSGDRLTSVRVSQDYIRVSCLHGQEAINRTIFYSVLQPKRALPFKRRRGEADAHAFHGDRGTNSSHFFSSVKTKACPWIPGPGNVSCA